ncbi:MAG: hypothetical protein ABIP74_01125 [Candidatus Saccharimonas sp.]
MFIVGMFSWWYGAGWKHCVTHVRERIASLYDYFSLGLLLRTLFSPFRQISAGKVRGSISDQARAWFDRLISRCVGACVRSVVLLVGLITLAIRVLVGVLQIILWPLIPTIPVIAIVLAMMGWVPWHL